MLAGPDGKIEHTAATGNGPVQALDGALRKALMQVLPRDRAGEPPRLQGPRARLRRRRRRGRPRADRVGRRARPLGHRRRLPQPDRGELAGARRFARLQALQGRQAGRSRDARAARPRGAARPDAQHHLGPRSRRTCASSSTAIPRHARRSRSCSPIPGVHALLFYRVSHWLWRRDLKLSRASSPTSAASSPASTSTPAPTSAAASSSTTAWAS